MITRTKKLKDAIPEERFFEIKYEEFVTDPIYFGEEIRKFLGVEDSRYIQNKLRKAFKTSINISSKNQDSSKYEEAMLIAGDTLEEFGYK